MQQILQISAKTLGQLALPSFCPRCFWLRLRCPQLPYQIFPGIFSSIDSFTKKTTNLYFQQHRRLPVSLKEVGLTARPLVVPHWRKFQFIDQRTGIRLTGVPDEICQRRNGSLAILDYKTARYTPTQDELLPIYQVQLNCYALIAEAVGMGNTSWLGLAYYEPLTEISTNDLANTMDADGIRMKFIPKVIPVKLELEAVPPLLEKARDISDKRSIPMGLTDCRDCKLLSQLLEVV